MRDINRTFRLLAVGLLVAALAPMAVQAGTITYEETLLDARNFPPPIDFFRNLERTRTLGDGSAPQFETMDATIVLENAVGDGFGRQWAEPITYSHLFFPVGPVKSFQLASLQIVAGSVSGQPSNDNLPDSIELLFGLGTPDDPVEAEANFLGNLSPANPFVTTTFEYSTTNSVLIALLLADNRLDVTITPMGPGYLLEGDGDKISVRSSVLSVTYTVPEPGALLLVGMGLWGAAWSRRQRRLR